MAGGVVEPAELAIPPLYSAMSTSQASLRVLSRNPWAALSGMAAGSSLLLCTFSTSHTLVLIFALDIFSKVIQELGGFSRRMRMKAYGFMELARVCLTLTLAAILS